VLLQYDLLPYFQSMKETLPTIQNEDRKNYIERLRAFGYSTLENFRSLVSEAMDTPDFRSMEAGSTPLLMASTQSYTELKESVPPWESPSSTSDVLDKLPHPHSTPRMGGTNSFDGDSEFNVSTDTCGGIAAWPEWINWEEMESGNSPPSSPGGVPTTPPGHSSLKNLNGPSLEGTPDADSVP